MLSAVFSLLFAIQVACEWVEISQQHYQKPLRVSHNFPAAASPVQSKAEKKLNRVYINNSLPEYNWDSAVNINDVKLGSGALKFNKNGPSDSPVNEEFITRRYTNKEDILIIRKPRPGEKTETRQQNPKGHKNTGENNILKVQSSDIDTARRKPANNYKRPIEVLNLSDLEYITEHDNLDVDEFDEEYDKTKRKQIIVGRITTESDVAANKQRKHTSKPNSINSATTDSNNLRRGTKPSDYFDDKHIIIQTSNAPEIVGSSTYKLPHGHIKRVHITESTVRAGTKPKVGKPANTSINISTQKHNMFSKPDKNFDTSTKPYKNTMTTERSENRNDRVRSQTPYDIANPDDIMIKQILKEVEEKIDVKVHKVASIGTVKRVSNPIEASKINKNKKHTYDESDEDGFVEDEEPDVTVIMDKNTGIFFTSTEAMPVLTTITFKSKPNLPRAQTPKISTQIEKYNNPHRHKTYNQASHDFVTKYDESDTDYDNFRSDTQKTFEESKITTRSPFVKTTTQNRVRYSDDVSEEESVTQIPRRREEVVRSETRDDPNEANNSGTMENLIKFLKTVTSIISRNTRRGVQSKMRYLEDLRDTLLVNIEERIEDTFPDDADSPRRRRAAPGAEPRGSHVEFPSSESALMTISFLTFAVFLIKLILQVIQAYKNKTMMVMPTMVAAVGRSYMTRDSRH